MLEEKCAYCGDMTDMPFECNFPLSEPTFANKSSIDKFGINDFAMC